MTRWGVFVLAVLLGLAAQRSSAWAQARDLGSPRGQAVRPTAPEQDEFGDAEAPRTQPLRSAVPAPTVQTVRPGRVPSDTRFQPVRVANPALGSGPAPGRVLVRFEGDASRNFVVTTLLGTSRATARFGFNTATATADSYALLCRLACDAWLDPGAYQFGLGRDAYPTYRSPIFQINGPTLVTVHYSDHALIRGLGGLGLLLGLGLGALSLWALIEREPDFAIAAAVAGGVVLFAGLGMVFSNDGVRFTWAPLRL